MKRLGHCTVCDTAVFEFDGSNLRAPLENARRVTLAMLDGSTADVTLCETCVSEQFMLSRLHPILIESWRCEADDDYRRERGSPLLDAEGKRRAKEALRYQARNAPLGILRVESWRDAFAREARKSVVTT